MKKQIKETSLTVKITESKLKQIDAFAEKFKTNRSQAVRNMLDYALDDFELVNSTGMLTMALKGIDLLEVVKKSIRKKDYEVKNGNQLVIDL